MHDAGFGWERKQRASHYAAGLEARAGAEAALSAAGLMLGAPSGRRRWSPLLARLESTQILLHLTRHENEQGPHCSQPIPSRAFHWLMTDYLILAPTQWPPQRAVKVPSQLQRAVAKIWLVCKRSSQAIAAANSVQNKVYLLAASP